MSPSAPSIASLLRAGFLALLVLGLLVRPVLNQIGGVHSLVHAASEAADHGLAHDHGHDHGHSGDSDPQPDTDHTKGAHGLMHQADAGSASGILASWHMADERSSGIAPAAVERPAPPSKQPSSPFRPPIV